MGQRVHVVPTGRRVAPFGDAPGDLLILNRPLRQWQAEAFADAGLGVVDTADAQMIIETASQHAEVRGRTDLA